MKSRTGHEKKPEKEEKIRRMDKKVRGVAPISSTVLQKERNTLGTKADMHEIILNENEEGALEKESIHISPYGSEAASDVLLHQEINQEQSKPIEKNFL